MHINRVQFAFKRNYLRAIYLPSKWKKTSFSGFLPLNHYQNSVINSLRSFQHSKTPTSILQHSKTQLCSKIDISKTAWINTCTYIQKIFFKEHLSVKLSGWALQVRFRKITLIAFICFLFWRSNEESFRYII